MSYAKIDGDGNIIKYPVLFRPLQPIPSNHVLVDIETNLPKNLKWYETAIVQGITRDGDKYIMNYTVGDAYPPNSPAKKEEFRRQLYVRRMMNLDQFKNELIDQEKFDSNNLKLDMTNPDDESTYPLLDELEF